MRVEFIGFEGGRQDHQDWALEIITETGFEKSFFSALFKSDMFRPVGKLKQMQPISALLYSHENGISIMVSSERRDESRLCKAEERIAELEQILKDKDDKVAGEEK